MIKRFLFLLAFAPLSLYSQKTYYFNKIHEVVDSSTDYESYAVTQPQSDGIYVKYYYSNDTLYEEGLYSEYDPENKAIVPEGRHKYYHYRDTVLWYTREYKAGKVHGDLRSYYYDGKIKRIERYDNGEFINGECFKEDGSRMPFTRFESRPEFPGGENALMQYLSENIKYPKKARKKGIQGQVILTFVVNKDGSISDINVLKDPGEGCGEESVRLIREMPRWQPGMVDGKPVKVRYTLPLRFKLY